MIIFAWNFFKSHVGLYFASLGNFGPIPDGGGIAPGGGGGGGKPLPPGGGGGGGNESFPGGGGGGNESFPGGGGNVPFPGDGRFCDGEEFCSGGFTVSVCWETFVVT